MRRTVILLAGAVCIGAPRAPAQDAITTRHESQHYRLEVNGDIGDPRDFLKLAEALYRVLATYHKKAPPTRRKLVVRFWQTRQAYIAGATADGIPRNVLNAGGYYATSTKTAYFWRQPNRYSIRHLFLHELVHQFQYNAVLGGSRRQGQAWYIEGIAEYFAYHRWDGTTLQTGLSDIVCLEKRLTNVIGRARAGTLDLAAVIEGTGRFDRGDYWGVVHFLLHGADPRTRKQWKMLERKLWTGSGNAVVAKALLGGRKRAALVQACRAYVADLPHTWQIEWVNWDMHGDALRGWSATQALMHTRARYTDRAWIEVTVLPGPGRVVVGVGKRRTTDMVGLALERDGRVHYTGRASGGGGQVDASKPVTLRLEASADGVVRGSVNGQPLPEQRLTENPAAGPIVLLVGKGDRRFADWTLAEPPKQ